MTALIRFSASLLALLLFACDGKSSSDSPSRKKASSASAEELCVTGHALIQDSEYAIAIPYLENATILDPELEDAHGYLGLCLLRTGEYEKAAHSFSRAIALSSNPSTHLSNRAAALLRLDRNTEAVKDSTRSIKADANNSAAFAARGLAFQSLGKSALALTDYDMAIRLNPDDAITYANRGVLHLSRGLINSAERDFKKAAQIDGSLKQRMTIQLWKIDDRRGRMAPRQIEDLTRLIDAGDAPVEAYRLRAEAYDMVGRPKEAEKDRAQITQLRR